MQLIALIIFYLSLEAYALPAPQTGSPSAKPSSILDKLRGSKLAKRDITLNYALYDIALNGNNAVVCLPMSTSWLVGPGILPLMTQGTFQVASSSLEMDTLSRRLHRMSQLFRVC